MRSTARVGALLLLTVLGPGHRAWAGDVVVIVSAKSRIAELTQSQVTDLFLGRLKQLSDGTRLVPVDHPEGSAARDEFYSRYAGKTPAQLKAYWSKMIFTGRGQPPVILADAAEVRKRVARDPQSIAYLERALADDTVRILPP